MLLGKANPAGRLPATCAKQLDDYAATDPRFPERSITGVNHKTRFSEGVNAGYRRFDSEKIAPLFPFGHGLSYTSFAYSALRVGKAADGGLDVGFQITNTGAADGDEVPQVYLGPPATPPAGAQFPSKSLAAFDRIHLAAGEAKAITLHVTQRQLQYWSIGKNRWEVAPGPRRVGVGASSRDIRLRARYRVNPGGRWAP